MILNISNLSNILESFFIPIVFKVHTMNYRCLSMGTTWYIELNNNKFITILIIDITSTLIVVRYFEKTNRSWKTCTTKKNSCSVHTYDLCMILHETNTDRYKTTFSLFSSVEIHISQNIIDISS